MKPLPVMTRESAKTNDFRYHMIQIAEHVEAAMRIAREEPLILGAYYSYLPTLSGSRKRGIVEEAGSAIAALVKLQQAGELLAKGNRPTPIPHPTIKKF